MARAAALLLSVPAAMGGGVDLPDLPGTEPEGEDERPAVMVWPDDDKLQYIGRFEHGSDSSRFDFGGCEIRMRVQGARQVRFKLSQMMGTPGNAKGDLDVQQRNEFVVYIDGVRQPAPHGHLCPGCSFDTFDARNDTIEMYTIANELASGRAHDIRVVKATEAQWNDRFTQPNWVEFHGFELDGGRAVPPLHSLPLRRVEFIGDSAAAGYCNTCDLPMMPEGIKLHDMFVDWTADEYWRAQLQTGASGQSIAASWPHQVCEGLGAQCHTAAWSGVGLTHECCGGDTTMDKIWRRAVGTDPSSKWDYSAWIPDALVINIGMNDGMLVNTTNWLNTYVSLVQSASAAYGGDLHVFLACGPITGRYCAAVQRVVDRVQGLGVRAHFLDQRPFLNGTYGGACCGHPSGKVARAMADAAVAQITRELGWGSAQQADWAGNDQVFSQYQCMEPGCDHGLIEMLNPAHTVLMGEL